MEEKKTLTVVAPDGYEIDKEKSTFDKIVFKKKEDFQTYTDVAKKLFTQLPFYYTNDYGDVCKHENAAKFCFPEPNNAPTKEQLEWLMALNKLKNTAVVLNDGWKPDWNDCEMDKFGFAYQHSTNEISPYLYRDFQVSTVYFKTRKLALKAAELLGEETIKTALGMYLID